MTREILGLIFVLILVVVALVLTAAEAGLTFLSRARARALRAEGQPGSETLARIMERRELVINELLLLILACHVGAAAVVGAVVQSRFGGRWVVLALPMMVVVIYLITYALPRSWALRDIDRTVLRLAALVSAISSFPPLRWLSSVLLTIARAVLPGRKGTLGPTLSEEELVALLGVAEEAEVIDTEERRLLTASIEFGDTVVREVMVPRTDMATVEADFRVDAATEVSLMNGFSRFPVVGEGIDDVVGIVHVKDLMRATLDDKRDEPVVNFQRVPFFVPETKRVAELLGEMRQTKNHLAVVVDEYGGTAGLVTLEDLIEELVGEIEDEFDNDEKMVEPLADGALSLSAKMPLDEASEVLGVELPEGDWDTIGGLLFAQLGHVPAKGESVEVEGVRLFADQVKGRRIERVRVMAPSRQRSAQAGAATADSSDADSVAAETSTTSTTSTTNGEAGSGSIDVDGPQGATAGSTPSPSPLEDSSSARPK